MRPPEAYYPDGLECVCGISTPPNTMVPMSPPAPAPRSNSDLALRRTTYPAVYRYLVVAHGTSENVQSRLRRSYDFIIPLISYQYQVC